MGRENQSTPLRIGILSRNKNFYSTRSLVAAAEERGHDVMGHRLSPLPHDHHVLDQEFIKEAGGADIRCLVIMEVNSSPGLEGIETATGKDIPGKIIEFIKKLRARTAPAPAARNSPLLQNLPCPHP